MSKAKTISDINDKYDKEENQSRKQDAKLVSYAQTTSATYTPRS